MKARFWYDADGNRIQSWTVEEGRINYVYNLARKVIYEDNLTEGTKSSFVYAFGKQIAKVEGKMGEDGEKLFYHHDNLGSARLTTDGEGKVTWEMDYLPFGEDLHKPNRTFVDYSRGPEYRFTGQRQVVGIGLYYYGARYYDPELGRFITEDTYVGEMGDAQTQNLMIYVTNNPLKYIDPSGNMPVPILRTISTLYQKKRISDEGLPVVVATFNVGDLWTTFHEIAQIQIANDLFLVGYQPILEYPIVVGEVDIVAGIECWEVKPLGGASPKKQLEKYTKYGDLILGHTRETIDDIYITDEIKMRIQFPEIGVARYSFYKKEKDNQGQEQEVAVSTREARAALRTLIFLNSPIPGIPSTLLPNPFPIPTPIPIPVF